MLDRKAEQNRINSTDIYQFAFVEQITYVLDFQIDFLHTFCDVTSFHKRYYFFFFMMIIIITIGALYVVAFDKIAVDTCAYVCVQCARQIQLNTHSNDGEA